MAVKTCERCGDSFTSQRSNARFCGPTCRKAAEKARERARAKGNVVQLTPKPRVPERSGGSHNKTQAAILEDLALADGVGAVEVATRARFDELGVNGADPQAVVAIALAQRIDRNASETGAGLRALVTAYNETLQVIIGSQKTQADPLDMLRQVRERIAEKAKAAAGA